MIIETQYELGAWLWPIIRSVAQVSKPCPFCDGAGTVAGANGDHRRCPDCYGQKVKTDCLPEAWAVGDLFRVGRIEAGRCTDEVAAGYDDPNRFRRIVYMAGASGTMWPEERLFPSKSEAQAACDRLNAADVPGDELLYTQQGGPATVTP